MKIAEVMVIAVLLVVLIGGSLAWVTFIREQDRERRERERRLEENQRKRKEPE